MSALSLLLLSDLHAFSTKRDQGDPSYINANNPAPTDATDAFAAVKSLIKRERLTVDAVICAGDLGDRADSGGISHAWKELHEVGRLASAKLTFAVCGNHDVDSRHLGNAHDPDPKGVLQELVPLFPLSDQVLCDKFWGRNFVTVDIKDDVRVLMLNSSAFHGGLEAEIEHGRIADRTINQIRLTLAGEGKRLINVCVCHHHPFPHARFDGRADYEAIKNGQALLDLLDRLDYGPWIVLHGHRHHARIDYAPGSVSPPIVIGAATFSARISEAANQVHLVQLDAPQTSDYYLRGTVRSWTFSLGSGFVLNQKSNNALPGDCGFGYRGNIVSLANRIAQHVRGSGNAYEVWKDVETRFEAVRYLPPKAFASFIQELKTLGVSLLFDEFGNVTQAMAPLP